MRISSFLSLAVAVCACLVSTQTANAQNQAYEFFFGQSSYAVDAGDTVDVTVFLRETGNGSTPRLAPGGGDGLFSFDLTTDFSAFTGGSQGSSVNDTSDVTLNPEFSFFNGEAADLTLADGSVRVQGTEDFAASDDGEFGVNGTLVAADVYELLLTTLTFTAGDSGTTTLVLSADLRPNGDPNETLFADQFQPSDAIFTGSQIVINAIPEPSSLMVLGGMFGGLILRRKRRS